MTQTSRRMLVAAMLLCAAGCSAGGKLASSLSNAYGGLAGKPENDTMRLAIYSSRFREAEERWPDSFKELRAFVRRTEDKEIDLERLDNLSFKSKEDGRLIILADYSAAGFDDSTHYAGSTPPADKAVVIVTPQGDVKLIVDPDNLDEYK